MSAVAQAAATLEERLRTRTSGIASLADAQRAAAEAFRGFPSVTDEQWRYTNVAPIARATYAVTSEADSLAIERAKLGGAIDEIVIANGRIVSTPEHLPQGMEIKRAAELTASDLALVGSLATNEHPFAALNLALLDELLFVRVCPGCRVGTPLHIAHVVTSADEAVAVNTRVVIIVERSGQLPLIETFSGAGKYFTNTVTELHVGEGSIVDHVRLQDESLDAWHIANLNVRLERDAVLRNTAISRGSAIARNEISVLLDGAGAECTLNGLYQLSGTQRVENHTLLDHAKPHTNSGELYKGILDAKSNGIFDAKIVVRKDAQKINSKQTNKNLLLSLDAVADSNPQLEIHADDVKCGHGSTIGQLDEAQLFYLQSRGIEESEARKLLTAGFGGEVIDAIRIDAVRKHIYELLNLAQHTEEVA